MVIFDFAIHDPVHFWEIVTFRSCDPQFGAFSTITQKWSFSMNFQKWLFLISRFTILNIFEKSSLFYFAICDLEYFWRFFENGYFWFRDRRSCAYLKNRHFSFSRFVICCIFDKFSKNFIFDFAVRDRVHFWKIVTFLFRDLRFSPFLTIFRKWLCLISRLSILCFFEKWSLFDIAIRDLLHF